MTEWHVSIGHALPAAITPDDTSDILDTLAAYGAALSVSRDFTKVTISLTVEAATPLDAATEAERATRQALTPFNPGETTELTVITADALDAELATPIFPEVVGYAEIAKLAGVTRQRAHRFPKTRGFPPPVIETAQGPLYNVHAVERWLETRATRSRKEPTPA